MCELSTRSSRKWPQNLKKAQFTATGTEFSEVMCLIYYYYYHYSSCASLGNRLVRACGLNPKTLCRPCEPGTFTLKPKEYRCTRCSQCLGTLLDPMSDNNHAVQHSLNFPPLTQDPTAFQVLKSTWKTAPSKVTHSVAAKPDSSVEMKRAPTVYMNVPKAMSVQMMVRKTLDIYFISSDQLSNSNQLPDIYFFHRFLQTLSKWNLQW